MILGKTELGIACRRLSPFHLSGWVGPSEGFVMPQVKFVLPQVISVEIYVVAKCHAGKARIYTRCEPSEGGPENTLDVSVANTK